MNLTGGMSHIDSLDMKPDAPAEIRGEFKPIATAVPGIQVCEHLPLLAARMRHWALVRSLSHGENGHLPGTHRLLTGATMPNQRQTDLDNVLSRRDWPCYAAALNHLRPRHDGIPNGVTLPHALIEGPLTWPGQHAGFLGPSHDPMLVTQDPNSPNFRMDAFALPAGTDPARVDERRGLLEQLESGGTGDPAFREHQRHAFELLASGRVAGAFRLDREPVKVRDRYGRNQFGQSLLLARRLVQAGVPIVQANMGIVQTWDTHVDNWGRLKNRLLPWLDQALAALVDDLEAQGLWDQTFVAVLGRVRADAEGVHPAGRDDPRPRPLGARVLRAVRRRGCGRRAGDRQVGPHRRAAGEHVVHAVRRRRDDLSGAGRRSRKRDPRLAEPPLARLHRHPDEVRLKIVVITASR